MARKKADNVRRVQNMKTVSTSPGLASGLWCLALGSSPAVPRRHQGSGGVQGSRGTALAAVH